MLLINPNNKYNNFIQNKSAELNGQRVIGIALPLLSAMNSRVAAVSSIGLGCYQLYSLWMDQSKDDKSYQCAALVSSMALGYFSPNAQLLLSSSIYIYDQLKSGQGNVKKGFAIAEQSIYLLSAYYKTPVWMILSLLSQTCSELVRSYEKFPEKGSRQWIDYFDAAASLYMNYIRVAKAYLYIQDLRRAQGVQNPIKEQLVGKKAFYNQSNYVEKTAEDLAKDQPLDIAYKWESEDKHLYAADPGLIHTLAGNIILPASNPKLMGYPANYAGIIRRGIPLNDEWKYKRFTVQVDHHLVDAMIVGKPTTLGNKTWVLASNGNGEFYENKMADSPDFKQLLENVNGNGIVFNYPGVGASEGRASKDLMTKSYRAILSFLEDENKGIGAKKIIGYGHSIGGGVQGDALLMHKIIDTIQYVFVKSRTFSDLASVASVILNNPLVGSLIKLIQWNLETSNRAKRLQAPEIVLQTARVQKYELVQDPNKIIDDGVIPSIASHAYKLLTDDTAARDNKWFVGIPDKHNDLLSNIPFIANLINSILNSQKQMQP